MADATTPDSTITPRSPLGGHAAMGRLGRRDGPAGVRATVMAGRAVALATLRAGRRQELGEAVGQAFALVLPDRPRRLAGNGVAVQWHGPGRWLFIAERDPPGGIERDLAMRLGEHASIVDLSHASLHVRLAGDKVRDALAKGLPVDHHPRAFGPGDVALTSLAHVALTVAQLDAGPTYEIATPRSTALSFWHWLEASCGEFGLMAEAASPA